MIDQASPLPRERLAFLREWAAHPLRTAAVAPSGSRLAGIITSDIDPDGGPVIELGPGTGVFTRALLTRGVAPEQLALVELNPRFATRLQRQYPQVQVVTGSAAALQDLSPFAPQTAGAIVSGLGLLAMPDEVVSDILDGAFHCLAPGRAFYQFTYGWRCPVKPELMARHGLVARQFGWTLRNLPPAQVYQITKPVH